MAIQRKHTHEAKEADSLFEPAQGAAADVQGELRSLRERVAALETNVDVPREVPTPVFGYDLERKVDMKKVVDNRIDIYARGRVEAQIVRAMLFELIDAL
jgi:hypothetical protein